MKFYDEKIICFKFKNLGFKGGEEIEILKGIEMSAKPVRCTVVKEYPKFLQIRMEFPTSTYEKDGTTNSVPTGINKGAMYAGDVVVRRKSDNVILTRDEVGVFYSPEKLTTAEMDREWKKQYLRTVLWNDLR